MVHTLPSGPCSLLCHIASWPTNCLHGLHVSFYYRPSVHNCQKCWPVDPQKVQILISIMQHVCSWNALLDESKLSFYQLKSPPLIHVLSFSPFTHIIVLAPIMPLHLKSYLTIVNKIFVNNLCPNVIYSPISLFVQAGTFTFYRSLGRHMCRHGQW